MLPGDLLRRIKRLAYEPGNLHVFLHDSGDESDQHRAMLYYGPHEVCALPLGDIPPRNRYEYQCFRCGAKAGHPWVCKMGAPPPGFERRGAELLREPTGQGHEVVARLVRRGSDAILQMVRDWRDPGTGRPLVRWGA